MYRFCAVSFLLVSACLAQFGQSISGQIEGGRTMDLSSLTVRLEGTAPDEAPLSGPVGYSGEFTLSGVRAGNHILRVLNSRGEEIASSVLTVGGGNFPVTVKLPEQAPQSRPTGDTVTVAQLRHQPPKAARKAAEKGQKFSQAGDYAKAAEELKRAVTLDPEFSIAYNNLGVEYTRLGKEREAAEAFRKCVELDPANAAAQANLAVALARAGERTEAEKWARSAIQMDRDMSLAQYVLGCLLAQRGATAEAAQHLNRAAARIPAAQKALVRLYRTAQTETAETTGHRKTVGAQENN